MSFFDLIIRWVGSSDFWPTSDDLGHWILESDYILSDFAKSDCITRPILFSHRFFFFRRSESDLIVTSLTADVFHFLIKTTSTYVQQCLKIVQRG